MPDYISSSSGQNFLDAFQIPAGMIMEDDFMATHLKVPTNTPTAAPGDSSANTCTCWSPSAIHLSLVLTKDAGTGAHSVLVFLQHAELGHPW